MRIFTFAAGCAFALGLAACLQASAATVTLRGDAAIGSPSQNVFVASHKCGQGQRWVPAGYAKHGKYRPGHCAPA
jgi:hypothetical protein